MNDLRHLLETALLAIGGLLPIVDPLSGSPVYLAMTADLRPQDRGPMAKAVAVYSFSLLIGSSLVGVYVLDFFGISIPAVQIGGGIVVCVIAWSLLNNPSSPTTLARDAVPAMPPDALSQRAFYPLTMPLTVGPGSISVALTLGANHEGGVRSLIVATLGHTIGIALVALSVYFCYRYAEPILKRVGATATMVLVRLTAFILLCIGVQIAWNGLHALLLATFAGTAR
jgi:multiple antibiotic resistance protein